MSPPEEIVGKVSAEGEIYFTPKFFEGFGGLIKDIILEQVVGPLEELLPEPTPLYWHDIREYKLDSARKNERIDDFPDEGDVIYVISISEGASVGIKFDSPNADSFNLSLDGYKKIRHSYTDIFLTNDAQSGATIKILFGRGDWDFVEKILEMDIQGTIRNDYLDQLTDPLKIGQIIKDSHIMPHADIACEKILLSGTRRLDQWLSTEDYTYMAPGMILLHGTKKLSDWRHPSDLALFNGGQIFAHSVEVDKLSVLTHILSGATWADNSPVAGSVAWSGAKMTYNGHTYTIANGNTNKKYIWWDLDNSTAFQTSDAKPAITDDDCIVAYNDAGTHELIWNATLIDGRVIRTGSITADEINVPGLDGAGDIVIEDGVITAPKIAVDYLSAINENVGTLTVGMIRDVNSKVLLDLTNALLTINDGKIVLKDNTATIIITATGITHEGITNQVATLIDPLTVLSLNNRTDGCAPHPTSGWHTLDLTAQSSPNAIGFFLSLAVNWDSGGTYGYFRVRYKGRTTDVGTFGVKSWGQGWASGEGPVKCDGSQRIEYQYGCSSGAGQVDVRIYLLGWILPSQTV